MTTWGILATGTIAQAFARELALVPGARIAAVGSRSRGSAEAFAAEYGDADTRPHASYDDLFADPDVEVVYVATPHSLHLDNARGALEAGKHVLCEKPLTLNRAEADQLVGLARQHDRFLMEGMWMTCHPVIRAVHDGLQQGRFGTPRQVHADLGFAVRRPRHDRLLNPDLGGGALLDMGVYPLTFADLVLGPAEELTATAVLSDDGIDLDVAIAGRYAGGAVAALTASMTSGSPRSASIATDTGRLDVPADFHHPTHVTWTPDGGEPERVEGLEPVIGSGLGTEAAEVQRCLDAGLRESPLCPHDRTLRVHAQMDELRRQIGVAYPGHDS